MIFISITLHVCIFQTFRNTNFVLLYNNSPSWRNSFQVQHINDTRRNLNVVFLLKYNIWKINITQLMPRSCQTWSRISEWGKNNAFQWNLISNERNEGWFSLFFLLQTCWWLISTLLEILFLHCNYCHLMSTSQ